MPLAKPNIYTINKEKMINSIIAMILAILNIFFIGELFGANSFTIIKETTIKTGTVKKLNFSDGSHSFFIIRVSVFNNIKRP